MLIDSLCMFICNVLLQVCIAVAFYNRCMFVLCFNSVVSSSCKLYLSTLCQQYS